MSTSQPEAPVELPRMPDRKYLSVSQQGEATEYYFEKRYGRYKDVPYYEEAKRLYLHKRINSKNESGVNTWHEQVLAGRVTPGDIKTIGYTNIAYFKLFTTTLLIAMTDPKSMMDARTVRAIMDAARKSYAYTSRGEEQYHPQSAIHKTYFLGYHFGGDLVLSLRNHYGICESAETLIRLNSSAPDKAVEVIRYIESYYDELRPLTSGHQVPEAFYKKRQILNLMEAGVSPQRAAEGTVQGLSVERVITGREVPSNLTQGVL